MTYRTLEFDLRDNVAWITFNRPERFNAMDLYLTNRTLSAQEALLGRDRGPPAVRRARAGADPRVRCRERQIARVVPVKSELL